MAVGVFCSGPDLSQLRRAQTPKRAGPGYPEFITHGTDGKRREASIRSGSSREPQPKQKFTIMQWNGHVVRLATPETVPQLDDETMLAQHWARVMGQQKVQRAHYWAE